jgi:hypothetical protein
MRNFILWTCVLLLCAALVVPFLILMVKLYIYIWLHA